MLGKPPRDRQRSALVLTLQDIMKDDSVIELAIVGAERAAEHAAAICGNPRLRLHFERLGEAFTEAESTVDALVICAPPAEREFWALRGARAGKAVLLDGPLTAATSRGLSELNQIDKENGKISMASAVLSSEFAERLMAARERLGRSLYVDLNMRLDRELLNGTRRGVADLGATELLLLGERMIGPLDSVQARTRSLATNRPREDAVWAMLRFVNGTEGIIQVSALDSTQRLAVVVHGTKGTVEIAADLATTTKLMLERQYRDLVAVVSGCDQPECGMREIQRCAFLSAWLEQSARQGCELFSTAVRLE